MHLKSCLTVDSHLCCTINLEHTGHATVNMNKVQQRRGGNDDDVSNKIGQLKKCMLQELS